MLGLLAVFIPFRVTHLLALDGTTYGELVWSWMQILGIIAVNVCISADGAKFPYVQVGAGQRGPRTLQRSPRTLQRSLRTETAAERSSSRAAGIAASRVADHHRAPAVRAPLPVLYPRCGPRSPQRVSLLISLSFPLTLTALLAAALSGSSCLGCWHQSASRPQRSRRC